jgi:hypothetical protein
VPLAQPGADLLGGVRPALPLTAGQHRPGRRDAGETGQAEQLRHPHGPDGSAGPELSLDAAVDLTRTGDDPRLLQGATLGPGIPVAVPAAQPSRRTR